MVRQSSKIIRENLYKKENFNTFLWLRHGVRKFKFKMLRNKQSSSSSKTNRADRQSNKRPTRPTLKMLHHIRNRKQNEEMKSHGSEIMGSVVRLRLLRPKVNSNIEGKENTVVPK